MMSTINPKTQIKISVLAFCLFALAIALFVYSPLISALQSKADTLAQKSALVQEKSAQIKEIQDFKENYGGAVSKTALLETSFLNYSAPVEFFEFVEGLANGLGITALDITPLGLGQEDKPQEGEEAVALPMNFQITVGGDFIDCLRFLFGLENSPFLVDISEVSAQKIGEKSSYLEVFKELQSGQNIFLIKLKAFAKNKDDI